MQPASSTARALMAAMTEMLPEVAMPLRQSGRYLEVGCGVGGGLLSLLTTFPMVTAVGAEINGDVLAETRRWAVARGVADRAQLLHADARDLDEAAAFDAAF